MPHPSRLSRLGASIIRHRYVLVSLFAGIAAALIVAALLSTPTHSVVVATHDLRAGDIFSRDNVHLEDSLTYLPPDPVVDTDSLVGKRTLVDLPPGTPVRSAYLPTAAPDRRKLDTISLPVTTNTVSLLSSGDYIDIYAPSECTPGGECTAMMLTHRALVKDINIPDESSWHATQSASLVIGIDPADTSVVAGVPDPTILTIVLLPGSQPVPGSPDGLPSIP